MLKSKFVRITSLTFLSTASFFSFADGLSDLKEALNRLNGEAPLSAVYERSFSEVSDADDEDDRKETSGQVSVMVRDGEQGLQVTFSQSVLTRIEDEAAQKALDEEADTPTSNAVRGINAPQLKRLLSSANSLSRLIAKATYTGEEAHRYEDRDLRLLSFELPLEAIIDDKKTREYVSKFEGVYRVLIDEQGVPVETRTEFNGKGRAFIVLSVKAKSTEYSQFQVINNRLVRTHNQYENEFSSTFGDNKESGYNTITVQDNPEPVEVARTSYQF